MTGREDGKERHYANDRGAGKPSSRLINSLPVEMRKLTPKRGRDLPKTTEQVRGSDTLAMGSGLSESEPDGEACA